MALVLTGLTQAEQFKKAAEFAGVPESVFRGMWKVESAEGTNMRSSAGARGHFQLMPATQKTWEQRTGRKYNPDEFGDALTMAALTMKENLGATKGNVPDALRMYNNGTDRSRWNNPETAAYAGKVLGTDADTMTQSSEYDLRAVEPPLPDDAWSTSAYDLMTQANAAASGGASKEYLSDIEKGIIDLAGVEAAVGAVLSDQIDPALAVVQARAAVKPQVAAVTASVVEDLGERPIGQAPDASGWDAVIDTAAADVKQQEADDSITFGDKFGAAFELNTLTAGILRYIEREQGPQVKADPNFNYMDQIDEIEKDRSEDEIEALREAQSMGEVGQIKRAQDNERENTRVLATGTSTVGVIGYSLGAGVLDPVGWAAGFGIGKVAQVVGVGSRAAFAAGNVGKGFGFAAGEGAVGNVAFTAALDAMGEHQSTSDYATAIGFGLLFGVGGAALDYRGQAAVFAQQEFELLSNKIISDAAEHNAKLYEKAVAEVGPNATAEEIKTVATRIETDEQSRIYDTIFGDIGDDMRLFPRPDVEGTPDVAPTAAPAAAPTAAATPTTPAPVVPEKNVNMRQLHTEVLKSDSETKVGDMLRGIAAGRLGAEAGPQQMWLAETLAPIMDNMKVKLLAGDGKGSAGNYKLGANTMVLNSMNPEFAIHEALHAATSSLLRATNVMPEVKVLQTEFNDLHSYVRQYATDNVHRLTGTLGKHAELEGGFLANADELLAYGMTNPVVQDFLATIPAPPNRMGATNAWEYFKGLITDMYERFAQSGKTIAGKLKPEERSVLDALIESTGKLVDYAKDNKTAAVAANLEMKSRITNELPAATVAPTPKRQDSLPGALLNSRKKRKEAYKKYGLNDSISDDAERKLVAETYARAERILGQNPVDPARLRPLLAKVGWEATSTRMLLSDNPVMRATASILLENPEGAAGRKVTAAMTKVMRERVYLGNTLRDYENAYTIYRTKNGGSAVRDAYNDSIRRQFDKEVYAERDRRYNGKENATDDAAVIQAADILDAGYNRMLADQKYVRTIGSARLPDGDVRGYQPRRMAPGVVANLNDAQRRAFNQALSEEFQNASGFDKEFSDKFAIKYLERAVTRAKGAYDVPANLHSDDAADIVRDSLRALSMSEEQVQAIMGRFSRGGAGHTKARIDADLTTTYDDGAGGNLRLMDVMNTNNLDLFRSYARRVSGEVSLAKYGIMGEAGLKELRKAMEVGPDGMRATPKEMESFDQVAAEFLGRPFADQLGKWADNARSMTSALRLGGMGFNQFNEYSNGVAAVGVVRSLKAIASLPRLLKEVRDIRSGRSPNNSILGSMELYTGEFGMEGYRMRGMYDVNDGYEVYGTENIGVFSKAIRAGAHANRILSGHRALTAVQIRGMAEQIVQKSLRYIRDGVEDKALDDMGITAAVREAFRKDLNKAVTFNDDGLAFDITKISDNAAANAYMQAVQRGASQIIQEAYIGETGKWAHDGWLKLLTQFRTFGLTATQKQWRRQAFTHGTAKALGYTLGAMSVALPVHLARVQLRAAGRPDREEFLDREMSPVALGRATMNYVSSVGLLPDVLDIGSSAVGMPVSGGRSGNRSPFIGGQVVPAAGVVNDAWSAVQSRDPHKVVKLVPGSNLPYLQAAINQLDE